MDESTETKPTLEVWVEDTDFLEIKEEKEVDDPQYFEIVKMEADDETLADEQPVQQSDEETNDVIVEADDDEILAEGQLNELNSRKRECRKRTTLQKTRNSISYYPPSLSQRDKQFMNHRKSVLSTKTTNKVQMDILLQLMQANRDIACGFDMKMKQYVWTQFWMEAEQQLNAAGPPIKAMNDWKKVWSDQKKYVRKKAALNLQRARNGGGAYRVQKFSKFEETVFKLIGPKKQVEGIAAKKTELTLTKEKRKMNAKKEIQGPSEKICNSPQSNISTTNIDAEVAMLLEDNYETEESSNNLTNHAPSPPSKDYKDETTKISAPNVVENELFIHEKLFEKMSEIASDLKQHNIQIQDSLKEISRSLDQSNELNKKLLDETIQHNRELLKLRKIEIEEKIKKNRRLMNK